MPIIARRLFITGSAARRLSRKIRPLQLRSGHRGPREPHEGRAGDANESYLGFGHPIRAPADGVVVEARDDASDDRRMDTQAARANLNRTFGNYLVIDHGQGRFSLLGHIHKRSLRVKVGEKVRAGQNVAAVGAAGSSLFPHLHYELIDGPNSGTAEGLPSYFDGLVRLRGARSVPVNAVSIDSGDILSSR